MTEYVFSRDSLDNPEFAKADWKNYKNDDGELFKVVRIGDPFVVRTPGGDYIECKEGYLGVDSSGDVHPILAQELEDFFTEIKDGEAV